MYSMWSEPNSCLWWHIRSLRSHNWVYVWLLFLREYNVFNNSSLASHAKGVDFIHWSQEDDIKDSIGQEFVQVWAPKCQDLVRVGLCMTILSKLWGFWLEGKEESLKPLHTRDCEPIAITLQALSLVEKAEPVQAHFTLHLRDQLSDGCKVYVDSYMALNGSCFMLAWTVIKNHLLKVGHAQKPQHKERFRFVSNFVNS